MTKSTTPPTCEQCGPLREEVERLQTQITALQAELATAREHSGNSSKPPSSHIVRPGGKNSDPPRRPRWRKWGRQSGQPQHERPAFSAGVLYDAIVYRYDARSSGCGQLEVEHGR